MFSNLCVRVCCPESHPVSVIYPVSYLDTLWSGTEVEQLLQVKCTAAVGVVAVDYKVTVFSVQMLNFGIIAVELCGPPSFPSQPVLELLLV